MKHLFKKVGIFVFILLLFNALITYIVWETYYKDYSNVVLSYDSYLLADSRGEPLGDLLQDIGVFNFSQGSDSYLDMLRKLKYLVRKARVSRIIITVDDHTLSRFRESLNNLDRSIVYAFPDDFDNRFAYIKQRYIKRYISFFNPKSRDIIKTKITNKIINGKNQGSDEEWSELDFKQRSELAEIRADYHFAYKQKSTTMSVALEEIITFCKSNHIDLVGIKFPISNDYISIIQSKGYKADSLIKSRGYNVLDFTDIYRNNNNYFFNEDHLNEFGGRVFSDTLKRSLTIIQQSY